MYTESRVGPRKADRVAQPNPRSFAILAVAQAQGLELEIVDASRENAENHARLLKVNPLGQVPVLVTVDGYVLTECIPIALYSEPSPLSTPKPDRKGL